MRPGLLLLVLVSAACGGAGSKKPTPTPAEKGTSLGAKVTMAIGAAGGSIASGDGRFSLEFPMGALAADAEVGIEPITNTAPLGRGISYRLTPDGAQFMKPVTMKIQFAASDILGSAKEALRFAYQDKDGVWHTWTKNTRDDVSNTLTGETTHFTDVTMVLGWQLIPFQANLSPLEQLDLKLKYCEPEQISGPDGELAGLTPRCDLEDLELPRLVTVMDWAVNGISGGSITDGAISGMGRTGRYTAPGVAPTNNPVAVSCKFANGSATNLAVANVNIGSPGWTGSVSWTLHGNKTETMGEYMYTWDVSGSGTISVRPGPNEQPVIDTASSMYRYQYDEVVNQMYTQGACMHMVNQRTTEILSGMSGTNASVLIVTEGAMSTIAIGVPTGTTTGNVVVDATDNVTGSGCTSPMPTHTDKPSTGTIPSDTLIITVMGTDRLSGSKIVSVSGTPPREFAVSFDLSK